MPYETEIEQYILDEKTSIWIQETKNLPEGEVDAGVFTDRNLEKALEVISPLTKILRKKLLFEEDSPGEVEIEFGLIFSAKFGAILALSGLEANLKVRMNWKKGGNKNDGTI